MRINQNISAMNTHSRLTATNNAKSGSLAKLSSGLRINKAGDDAAGLAISEKMRGQVGGLKQAMRNAQDGNSLIQTAEGALTETHSILNRMRDLAVQAANDSNTNDDRMEIQKEIEQLTKEVTRVSTDTEFNTMKLLNGNFEGKGLIFHVGANSQQNVNLGIKDMGGVALGIQSNIKLSKAQATEILEDEPTLTFSEAGTSYANRKIVSADADIKFASIGIEAESEVGEKVDMMEMNKTINLKLDELRANIGKGKLENDGTGTPGATPEENETANAEHQKVYEDALVARDTFLERISETNKGGYYTTTPADDTTTPVTPEKVTGLDKKAIIEVDSKISSKDLARSMALEDDADTVNVNGGSSLDLTTQAGADAAISVIDGAVKMVSGERAKLGSAQNRLDHTINNLTATRENLAAAEGRIRDVDMAEEMMEFTRTNILSQAATAMLAQANQMPQSVLQLLG